MKINIHAKVLHIEYIYQYWKYSSDEVEVGYTKLYLVDITGKKYDPKFKGNVPVNVGDEIRISYAANGEPANYLESLKNLTQDKIIADFIKQNQK